MTQMQGARLLFLIAGFVLSGWRQAEIARADDASDWSRMKRQTPRGYLCFRAEKPPQIDGRLDDDLWTHVPWTDTFVDIEGDAKPKPAQATRVKMAWDEQNFYIAAQLDETHVWATLRERDSVIFHDNDFELFLDPDGDNHAYYEFEINALNTGWDLFLDKPYKDGGNADNRWNIEGLQTAVAVDGTLNDPRDTDRGWTIELAIPWKSLDRGHRPAVAPAAGERWRVNFSRVEWQHRINEGYYEKVPNQPENNWVWSPQGIVDMHRPERWGFVEFSPAAASAENKPSLFAPDLSLAARDLLMEIYHRQKAFHKRSGRWAGKLDELAWEADFNKAWKTPPTLNVTDNGFVAAISYTAADGVDERWQVTNDSRLTVTRADEQSEAIAKALELAGTNRPQLEQALRQTPAAEKTAMRFLIANMPTRDLRTLSAEFLRENVAYAYRAWNESKWKEQIPEELFLNDVLPYANVNERRDRWRKDFYEKLTPLVKEARSPGHAATLLNQKIYGMYNVKYSTKRNKADQSPYETIESGLASCTGLSVLLIDACRAVGVPARFVGTPLWSDKSGNHSWVEVWDDGWHFTGAAEPSGDKLDAVWFGDRASAAKRDERLHAIYAVSFRRTPSLFPMVWLPNNSDVFAVNVTDRYTSRAITIPPGLVPLSCCALAPNNERVAAKIVIRNSAGEVIFEGATNDERFDANDHRVVPVKPDGKYEVEATFDGRTKRTTVDAVKPGQLLKLKFDPPATPKAPNGNDEKLEPKKPAAAPEAKPATVDKQASSGALEALTKYLATEPSQRGVLAEQAFATVALTKEDAAQAESLLVADHAQRIRSTRADEMKAGKLKRGELEMPFTVKVFGEKPATGRSMYISMHGGGGAPKQVNDSQWENQKRLYTLPEGVYVVPRAPTDTWNLWHQDHIDPLFDRLIENLIVFEEVDPNHVYLMGYSAGGDGVYQLAPRMSDRFAAASMMAGHPNETSPLGLRNLPFAIFMGGKDAAYSRNKVAADWGEKLADLKRRDPEGYTHMVKIFPDKGHWMDREDAVAIPWMAQQVRNPLPTKIVWKQDDVTHGRFYWLAVEPEQRKQGAEVVATREKQTIDLHADQVERLTIRGNDRLFDLDQPLIVTRDGKPLATATLRRTVATLDKTLSERGDPKSVFSAEWTVALPAVK